MGSTRIEQGLPQELWSLRPDCSLLRGRPVRCGVFIASLCLPTRGSTTFSLPRKVSGHCEGPLGAEPPHLRTTGIEDVSVAAEFLRPGAHSGRLPRSGLCFLVALVTPRMSPTLGQPRDGAVLTLSAPG